LYENDKNKTIFYFDNQRWYYKIHALYKLPFISLWTIFWSWRYL